MTIYVSVKKSEKSSNIFIYKMIYSWLLIRYIHFTSDLIIPGPVTNGTAKICCLGLSLALLNMCSTVVIKNDSGYYFKL